MYYFIINPQSRSRKGMAIWGQVQRELRTRKVSYRFYFTKYRGHARKLASQVSALLSQEDILAVIGGDGTVNEVINGLSYPVRFSIGYIPTGSGNDFARSMGIPTETIHALELILDPIQHNKIDLGCICCGRRKRLFCVSTGIGYDAAICNEALGSPLKRLLNKIHLGKLTYAALAIKQLLFFKPCDMELLLDDCRTVTLKNVYFAAAMNQQYEGGGFQFCPDADATDGCLDVIAAADLQKWKVLSIFPIAYAGKHTGIKGIHILRCKKIHIKSKQKRHIHADGESMGIHAKAYASVFDHQLSVITRS